ncbi:related to peptidylarginine deiminase and related enzymes [Cephalotrichum gorgonifer]|uniref:Related to peptidylarginine deiminase and related enzymes n=1 Tax=Cephalotrichum gorgonifer TaxID=2041049 RepID=A0AAE8SUJ2_9PEZI|nr:related to peptidylarginine deiminase and related enzymes [Cephalotrichum gorgonifer]
MAWPGKEGILKDYPESLDRATAEVSAIAGAVAHFQPVVMIVGNERPKEAGAHFANVRTPFSITLHRIEGACMDLWMRDIAPILVAKDAPRGGRTLAGLDYNFNGWGGKACTPTTAKFSQMFLGHMNIERIETSIITEGGALETDGDGTLLLTESSIVNNNRNPGQTREDIENELRRTLGVEKIIWIPGRKGLDTTDCHIDALARFIRPGVVLLSRANESEETDWTLVYKEAREILGRVTDAKGRRLEIVEVEEPKRWASQPPSKGIDDINGDSPVWSYVNYSLVNGGIIMPQFGHPEHDTEALKTVQRLFRNERKVSPVLIKELPLLGGGIHCATQEIPAFA